MQLLFSKYRYYNILGKNNQPNSKGPNTHTIHKIETIISNLIVAELPLILLIHSPNLKNTWPMKKMNIFSEWGLEGIAKSSRKYLNISRLTPQEAQGIPN